MELEDIVNEEMLTTEDVNNMLEHTDKGRTKQTIRNCVTVLQKDPVLKKAIKRNELSGRIDIVKEVPWERRNNSPTVTDTDENNLKMYLEENYELTSERVIKAGVDIVSNENKYHPIRDYLESLVWDGVPRIENMLPHFLGAEKSKYTIGVMKMHMLAAISRIYEPGIKYDIMLCLVGSQGAGKSTFFKYLAIKEEWFSDNLDHLDDENIYRKLQNHWIIEMGEMKATITAKNIEQIKSFLSRQKETYKVPYEVHPEDRPRQCVFCGTSNDLNFLPLDRTGNRRFAPVMTDMSKAEVHILDNEAESKETQKRKGRKKGKIEFKTNRGKLYHADCLEILPEIQDNTIDLIFADPPFNLKKEYANGRSDDLTIINLASYLSIYRGKKVLVVDLDPQSNSTQAILPEETWLEFYDPDNHNVRKTIYDYFRDMEEGDANFNNIDIPVSEGQNNFKISLIPGHPKLSIIDDTMSKSWSETLSGDKGAIRKLNWLNQLKKENTIFDYILIDVGPSLGALNRSALLNSDYFLTPMASDIFSLLGISNIGDWIERWMNLYEAAIKTFVNKFGEEESRKFFDKYSINTDISKTTRYIGYSIQQYSKRKFKNGERPTQAYEKVINSFHAEIEKALGKFVKEGIESEELKLGDVPYVYSIIPLSQTANTPIFELSYATGVRGNQTSSVENYKKYLNTLAENFIKNVGE